MGVLYHPSSYHYGGIAQQSINCPQPGGSQTLNFPTAWTDYTDPAKDTVQGIIYEDGDTPAAGATIVAVHDITGDSQIIATTDETGAFSGEFPWAGQAHFYVDHAAGGYYAVGVLAGGAWFDPALCGRWGATRSAASEESNEGLLLWGQDGSHRNMPGLGKLGYMEDTTTNERYWFEVVPGGVVSESAPRFRLTPDHLPPDTSKTYTLYSADGVLLGAPASYALTDDDTPRWADSAHWYAQQTTGATVGATLGGRIHGAAVEADRATRITSGLVEPWRLGLEFGRTDGPLEVRANSDSMPEGEAAGLTFTAFQCAYCGGPVWDQPSSGGFVRWCCVACGAIVKAGFTTRTLAALNDWWTRIVKTTTGGLVIDRVIAGHPRPEEYGENDSYIRMAGGLTRWVARHITLGTLQGGAFADGESVADAEARLGRTVGPVMLKLELQADYYGGGKLVRVTAKHATEGSKILTAIVPPGAVAGDAFPLDWTAHHDYPRGYYTDVTTASDEGEGYLSATIVNDGPAWHSPEGVQVTHHTSTPWACDVRLGSRDPALAEDFAGVIHLAYCRDGAILRRTSEDAGATWSAATDVTGRAGWSRACSDPSVAIMLWREEKIMATSAGGSVLLSSLTGGDTWTVRV